MLTFDLCSYKYVYIVAKWIISVTDTNNANRRNKKLAFNINAPFRSHISKINNTYIDNAKGLDIVMPMFDLLEYSNNYCMTSGSLWSYYKDEVNDDVNENKSDCYRMNNEKTKTNKSFEYKTKMIGNTPTDDSRLDTEVFVPLKHLSNFWRSLDLPLINCETELDLSLPRNSVISEISRTPEVTLATGATFQINNVKLCISVVTLSINNNIKSLENLKQGIQREQLLRIVTIMLQEILLINITCYW